MILKWNHLSAKLISDAFWLLSYFENAEASNLASTSHGAFGCWLPLQEVIASNDPDAGEKRQGLVTCLQ